MVYMCKTKFWDIFVPGSYFILVHRKLVFQGKRKFRTIFDSIISPTLLKLEKWRFLLCSESLALHILWYTSCILGLFFLCNFFLKIHIYFQKSMHIFHNIPESQNAFHYICRVKDSERNKKHCSSIQIVGLIYNRFHSEKRSFQYKQIIRGSRYLT